MDNNQIKKIKENITHYLRDHLNDDSILVTDVFKYDYGHSYQLTHYGYKHLAPLYDFLDVAVECDLNIRNYSYIDKSIKGLYYVSSGKSKGGNTKIATTDKKFIKWIKLYQNDFHRLAEKGLTKRSK